MILISDVSYLILLLEFFLDQWIKDNLRNLWLVEPYSRDARNELVAIWVDPLLTQRIKQVATHQCDRSVSASDFLLSLDVNDGR